MAFQDERFSPEPRGFEDDDIPVIGDDMLHPEVEFEAGMSPVPMVSVAVIAACVVTFGFQVARGGLNDLNVLREMGALDPDRVKQGEIWRLLSATFLHGNFDHILVLQL
jgi:membrane associated rhomboid family serine protease